MPKTAVNFWMQKEKLLNLDLHDSDFEHQSPLYHFGLFQKERESKGKPS